MQSFSVLGPSDDSAATNEPVTEMASGTTVIQPAETEIRVSPADIFLLERWNPDATLSLDEQREALCLEYVRKGIQFHYPYYLQRNARLRHPYHASSLPQHDQTLLASIRSPNERNASEYTWLRTCYFDKDGNSTDAAHEHLFGQSSLHRDTEELVGGRILFDDSTRYDYGPGVWQQIFTRIPQLVDTYKSPEMVEQNKAEAMEEAQSAYGVEHFHDSEDEGETESGLLQLYAGAHWESVVGVTWVADEEALETGKVLIAWYDGCGRIVRWNRMRAQDTSIIGMLISGAGEETSEWQHGVSGEDYDVGGAFGPPDLSV